MGEFEEKKLGGAVPVNETTSLTSVEGDEALDFGFKFEGTPIAENGAENDQQLHSLPMRELRSLAMESAGRIGARPGIAQEDYTVEMRVYCLRRSAEEQAVERAYESSRQFLRIPREEREVEAPSVLDPEFVGHYFGNFNCSSLDGDPSMLISLTTHLEKQLSGSPSLHALLLMQEDWRIDQTLEN